MSKIIENNEIISFGWFAMTPGEHIDLIGGDKARFISDTGEEIIEVKDYKILSFWDKMDELNVWNWKNSYNPSHMLLDGLNWGVELRSRHGKELISEGYEKFPRNFKPFVKEINYLFNIRMFDE
jgi:hypothetical protein